MEPTTCCACNRTLVPLRHDWPQVYKNKYIIIYIFFSFMKECKVLNENIKQNKCPSDYFVTRAQTKITLTLKRKRKLYNTFLFLLCY